MPQWVVLRVRLVKKFAEYLNGVDLSDRRVGEVFVCSRRVARMLVLEGWGIIEDAGDQDSDSDDEADDVPAWHSTVKVRIIRQPQGRVDGVSLAHYHVGQIYELPSTLANYLVIEGYAIVEMRRKPRLNSPPRNTVITLHRAPRQR